MLTLNPERWMEDMWSVIGDRPLRHLVLPGSHDAGCSHLSETFPILLVTDCNTRTQGFKIAEQLKQGARHFEVRPLLRTRDKTWYLSHGSIQPSGFVGALGETLDNVLRDVREFARKNPKELVILRFTNYIYMQYNKRANVESADDFGPREKIRLIQKVTDALGSVMIQSNDFFIRLADRTPKELISNNRTVLCVFENFGSMASPSAGIFSRGGGGGRNPSATSAPCLVVGGDGRLGCAYIPENTNVMSFIGSRGRSDDYSGPYSIHGQQSKMRPALATGPDGTLYAVFVADDDTNSLLLVKSMDGGLTWSASSPLRQSTQAEPSLAVGKDGTLYALFAANNPTGELLLTTSTDGGESWQSQREVNKYSTKMGPSLATAEKDTLYALFVANDQARGLWLTKSTDGGKSWQPKREVHQATKMAPSLAVGKDGTLYAVFVANNPTNELLLIKSTDGGESWQPQRELKKNSTKMTPSLATAGKDTLHVLFVANDVSNRLLSTTSTDGGNTWVKGELVVTKPHFAAEGRYADSHDMQHVVDHQKEQVSGFQARAGIMLELSWHGTWHMFHNDPCLDEMAAELEKRLKPTMAEWNAKLFTPEKRPNTIWVDFYNARMLEVFEMLNRT